MASGRTKGPPSELIYPGVKHVFVAGRMSNEVFRAWYVIADFVIVRISSCALPEANLGAYLEFVERNELALYQSSPGLIEFGVLLV
jgi:hypothetical protein